MSYFQSFQTFASPLAPKPGPSRMNQLKKHVILPNNGDLPHKKLHDHHQSQLRSPKSTTPNTSRSGQNSSLASETAIQILDEVSDGYSGEEKSKRERKNRPGQKFGAKKKSWVWTWFTQDPNDANVASCDFCGRIITRVASDKGSPKKLNEHLKTHKLTKELINTSRSMTIEGDGMEFTASSSTTGFSGSFTTEQMFNANEIDKFKPGNLSPVVANDVYNNFVPIQRPTKNDNLRNLHRNLYQTTKIHKKGPSGSQRASDVIRQARNKGVNDDENPPISSNDNEPHTSNNRSSEPHTFITRNYSNDLENLPYSSMKFHKHLMKFLTENKLSINVIKSKSFQQLLYDLRPDSVGDLLELTGLYSSLLEVSRFDSLSEDRLMDNHMN